jgi:hypothetical protein
MNTSSLQLDYGMGYRHRLRAFVGLCEHDSTEMPPRNYHFWTFCFGDLLILFLRHFSSFLQPYNYDFVSEEERSSERVAR